MRRLPTGAALIAMLALPVLAGCAKFYWVKPGSTAEQFARDSTECEQQATVSPAAATSVEQSAYRQCLTAKGYSRQELMMPGPDAYRGIEKQP